MWPCLVVLMCLRIQDSHGWFWFDGKGAQTPGYPSTVGPTSPPSTEAPGTAGTSASVTEVLKVGEKLGRYMGFGDHFEGSAGEGGSGFGSESESSGSGSSQFESRESFVTSTGLSGIAVESTNVHELESNSSQTDQKDGHDTSRLNESISLSRNLFGRHFTEHDNNNTTQYSLEYSVSDRLLTNASDRSRTPRCLPVDSKWPFCTRMGTESFAVPNFLNQSSVEEIQVVLSEWAWLLRSRCHHSLEWFFCLLLTPRCGPPSPLPCRSFCEALRDSCWTLLDEGRLPVECHSLPEEKHDGYQCLSVSNQKGNSRLKCHLLEIRDAFSTSITCLSVTSSRVPRGTCLSVSVVWSLMGIKGEI